MIPKPPLRLSVAVLPWRVFPEEEESQKPASAFSSAVFRVRVLSSADGSSWKPAPALPLAPLPSRVFPEEESSPKPSVLPLAVLFKRVLPEEETRKKPHSLPSAVFSRRMLPSETERLNPTKKFVTWQFVTVTPVLPSSQMPPPDPAPVTV